MAGTWRLLHLFLLRKAQSRLLYTYPPFEGQGESVAITYVAFVKFNLSRGEL